jgi:amidase
VSGSDDGATTTSRQPLRPTASLPAPCAPLGWPAWRLRDAVVGGELSVVEVVRAHLDRLESVDPVLNAAVVLRRDAALRDAEEAQARLDGGATPGPLFGVPFTVKDVIATAGIPTRCGSAAFFDNVPEVDAVAVARLRQAGAILIAKTNCPEFAFGVTTANVAHGVTRNPWGAHSPGGSSGGEAALVAAGASALGLGTDYGGSLRWPAQCCGVLALRPGLGSADGTGQLPGPGGRMDGRAGEAPWSDSVQRRLQTVGPIARSVADLAVAAAVIGGAEVAGLPSKAVEVEPGALHGIRIGWSVAEGGQRVGSDVRQVIRSMAADLDAAGLATAEVSGVLDGLHPTFNALRDTDALADLRTAVGPRRHLVGLAALASLDAAPASAVDTAPLWAEIDRLRRRVVARLRRTPLLVVPVAPSAACDLDGTAEVDGEVVAGFGLMAQCRAVSALGFPVLSIPVGHDASGLPVSVQVVAEPGREDLLFRLGRVLEQLYGGWQVPPWSTT